MIHRPPPSADYRLVAAVQEERLTRHKGSGDGIPWLAIDEVLRIAGWTRHDVDAIASTRAFYPTIYLRPSLFKEVDYAVRRWRGKEPGLREMWRECQRRGTADTNAIFAAARFLDLNGFRPDTRFHFANHHAAHALPALFFTDWQDALLFTADGIGDNVSYSIRILQNGALDCHFGDDRDLLRALRANSIGQAYSFATALCGFRKLRHEGKLTGLAAYGEPTLAPAIAQRFRVGADGLVATDFPGEVELGDEMARICKGASRETIAASIQKATRGPDARGGAPLARPTPRDAPPSRPRRRTLCQCAPQSRCSPKASRSTRSSSFPAMGDDGLCVGAALLRSCSPATWPHAPGSAGATGSTPSISAAISTATSTLRSAPSPGFAGDSRTPQPTARSERGIAAEQVGAALSPAAWNSARARSGATASSRREPGRPCDQRRSQSPPQNARSSCPFAPYVLDERCRQGCSRITPARRSAAMRHAS